MHLTLKKKMLMHAHRYWAFSGGWRCAAEGGLEGGGVIVSEGARGQTLPQGCREEEGGKGGGDDERK